MSEIAIQDIFPDHKCGLFLTHNEHRDYYETIERWTEGWECPPDWVSEEQKAKAIAEDSVWSLQWYPDTPIGSYRILGADLQAVLLRAKEIELAYRPEKAAS